VLGVKRPALVQCSFCKEGEIVASVVNTHSSRFFSGGAASNTTQAQPKVSVLASPGSWVAVRGRLGGRVILHEAHLTFLWKI
jgi:hypothetical protein